MPSGLEDDYREACGHRSARRGPDDVRVEFVPEPRAGRVRQLLQLPPPLQRPRRWSACASSTRDTGPDVIEFPDFLGEGLVTVQARRGRERFLRDTRVHVRLHTTAEICSVLDGFVDDRLRVRASSERRAPGAPRGRPDHLAGRRRAGAHTALLRRAPSLPRRGPRARADRSTARRYDARTRRPAADELRLLYVGRLERRKGVQDLVRAMSGIHRDGWSLTLVGGDTDTAPLGMSMRDQLELSIAAISVSLPGSQLPRDELARLVADSHVVVCPSRWECWPSVVLEALAARQPVLGTPTGGLVEMLGSGDAGLADRRAWARSRSRAASSLLEQSRAGRRADRVPRPAARLRPS